MKASPIARNDTMRLDASGSGPFAPLLDLRRGSERSGARFGVIIRVEPIWVYHPPTFFQHPSLEPFPDQPQKRPIVNPQLEHLQELVVVDPVEKPLDVNLDDVTVTTKLDLLLQRPHCLTRIPPEPVCPTARQKDRLVDGIEDARDRGLE